MVRLLVDAEDVVVLMLVIANYGLNFGLVELLLEHLLSGNWQLPLILEIAIVWGHDLSEGFMDSSKHRFENVFAGSHLSGDASPG